MRRVLLLTALISLGCAHGGEVDLSTLASSSDQILWEAGEKASQKKNWQSARQIYKRIIDGFPQSEYGPASRLALGDSYFNEGGTANLILAIGAYRDFLTLYPSHPKSDYAQFHVAESHFRQKNGPDRDQSETDKALTEFQRLLDLYPQSPLVEDSRKRIVECRQSLARSEFMAGFFYQRTRQACRAAISRYETVLSDYPDFEDVDEVLFRLGQSLAACNRAAEALPHLHRVLDEYKTSRFTDEAKRLYELLSTKAPAPPPASPAPQSPAPPTPTPSPTS